MPGRTSFFAAFVALVFQAGCGGKILYSQTVVGDDSGSGVAAEPGGDDEGGTASSPPGDPFPICPAVAPGVGTACTTEGQGCAYADYDKGTCISFICSGAKWVSSTPAGC